MDDEVFARLVEGDLESRVPIADARRELHEQPARWRSELIKVKQDLESQRSKRKAELAAFNVECWKRGAQGKEDYFEKESEFKTWNAKAGMFHRALESRLSDVKRIDHARHQQENPSVELLTEIRDLLRELVRAGDHN